MLSEIRLNPVRHFYFSSQNNTKNWLKYKLIAFHGVLGTISDIWSRNAASFVNTGAPEPPWQTDEDTESGTIIAVILDGIHRIDG